jgi:hypothetical protein
MQEMQNQNAQAQREYEMSEKAKDRDIEYAKIDKDITIAAMKEQGSAFRDGMRIDTDRNGIDDRLDIARTELDKEYKQGQLKIKEKEFQEKVRSNKANEKLKEKQINNQNKKKQEST